MHCWPLSAVAGDTIEVRDAPGDVTVVRDGLEPAVVWSGRGPIVVGDDWRSGMYIVRAGDEPPTAWFVVRGAGRIVLALATNTWNAYNATGGDNLYTGAVRLPFARPLAVGMLEKPDDARRVVDGREYGLFNREHELDMWHGMAGWAGQERRFVQWAEANGIGLAYLTNLDVTRPGALDGCELLLSVGHDEYWTGEMRDAVESFIEWGGNVAFLSGNTCYWQVRVEDDVMVSFKHRYAEDPVQSERTTTMWSDPITGRPESTMTGVTFTRGGYHRIGKAVPEGSGGYEIHRPDHWLLAGTGLREGDLLGAAVGAVGYECDGCDASTPDGFEIVGTAPAAPFDRDTTPLPLAPGGRYELEFHAERLGEDPEVLRAGHAVLGTYTRGGTVVTVGCTDWAYGLDDPAVARVTTNIIERLGERVSKTVGIIANPVSGRDVRRLLANAARSSIADKVTIIRRVVIGATQAGANHLLVLPDPHGLCRKALSTLQLDVEVTEIEVLRTHDERETIAAAAAMREHGAGAVVILGGDGTNRVFTMGWPDAPIVPLSTGTNNVFPAHVEPTIAGAAAGLVASGALALDSVARRAKCVHVEIDGEAPDSRTSAGGEEVALVDAVLTVDSNVGSRVPFDPSTLRAAVLTIADPAAVGISPIAGLVHPVSREEDAAIELRFGPGRVVNAPISPGLYAPVSLTSCEPIALGQIVEAKGPAILAFDGDRRRVVPAGASVRFRVERDGPMVIDVPRAMAEAARTGAYIS